MPQTPKLSKLTTHPGSDLRQLEIQVNNLINDVQAINQALTTDAFYGWYGVGPNSLTTPMGIGSTDTQIGTAACIFAIAGVPVIKARVDAGTAIGAQTVPADKWAIYALDIVAAGTITVTAGAANASTGYATEAAAIAALPQRVTVKARMGYITVKTKAATAWIAATDALAGGSSGNPASVTNYYPATGLLAPTGLQVSGSALVGGLANTVIIPTVLSDGSNDYAVASTAFTFNANGLTNIPKAAVTTGTTLGAATTTKGNWAAWLVTCDGAGTLATVAANNNVPGYSSEAAAIAAIQLQYSATKSNVGYFTVKTNATHDFVAGTDALQGGSSGNPASVTNYYPCPGATVWTGMSAAQIATLSGQVLTAAQF